MLLAPILLIACASNSEPETELVLSGPAIAQQLTSSLSGSRARFHVTADGRPASSFQLGDKRFPFVLPERVKDLGFAGQIIYRLNDINLNSFTVAATNEEFVLTAGFESEGIELKGIHSHIGDAAVPDIELNDMRLSVRLKPSAGKDGRIGYIAPKVTFTAEVDNTFIPRFSVAGRTIDVMDTLTNYRNELCRRIERQIQLALDEPERRASLIQKLNSALLANGMSPSSRLAGIAFRGTDLIVRLR